MARRNRDSTPEERDDFSTPDPIASLLLPPTPSRPVVTTWHPGPDAFADLDEVQDRRTWHPAGTWRSPATIAGTPATIAPGRPTRRTPFPHTIRFNAPDEVVTCVRRKTRREVIFAKRKQGRGARARRHRFNRYSTTRCK